jgi:hypothetical protein
VKYTVFTQDNPACVSVSRPAQLRIDMDPAAALQFPTSSEQEYCRLAGELQKAPNTGSVKLPLEGHCQLAADPCCVGCVVHTVAASFHALQARSSPEMYG